MNKRTVTESTRYRALAALALIGLFLWAGSQPSLGAAFALGWLLIAGLTALLFIGGTRV